MLAVELPDLATSSPLWLALLTVGVNAIVGALRAYTDTTRHWDIVGVTSFALLMGLGGGFIRDSLIGNVPAESLRRPWYLMTVVGAVVIVLLIGRWASRAQPLLDFLNALALAGAPNALPAVWGSVTYAAVEPSSTVAASFAGIGSVIVAQYLVRHLGLTTRPAGPTGGSPTEAPKRAAHR